MDSYAIVAGDKTIIRHAHLKKTRHAAIRQQQRNIPDFVIEMILRYGAAQNALDGCTSFSLNKQSRRQLEQFLGRTAYSKLNEYFNYYVVVAADDSIVTAAPIN
jgi:acyl CoA:acetate/3-ketoacid CoA transferase alpha subunit